MMFIFTLPSQDQVSELPVLLPYRGTDRKQEEVTADKVFNAK
jgi:hypothetical protein